MQLLLDLHDRAINGVVVRQRSVHIVVAKTAEASVPPFPGTTTVHAVWHPVGARGITESPPEAVAVGVGALLLVTIALRNDRLHRVTPLPKKWSTINAFS